jgi:ABC-type sugar transport system ATPase subunit
MLGQTGFESLVDEEQVRADREKLLCVRGLSRNGLFENINLDLQAAEIVGLAGLKGSGITEFMKGLFGALRTDGGKVLVRGVPVEIKSPMDAIRYGIGMLTNDRQKEGLALQLGVEENVTISSLDALSNRLKFLKTGMLNSRAASLAKSLDVKTPSLKQEVQYLSGGNQQKVVIAKWLLRNLDIILIDEPTRGVDVKAKTEIHRLLVELKKQGKGMIVFSPEIPELLGICDRILVVVSGRIVNEIKRGGPGFREADILELMHVGRYEVSCAADENQVM